MTAEEMLEAGARCPSELGLVIDECAISIGRRYKFGDARNFITDTGIGQAAGHVKQGRPIIQSCAAAKAAHPVDAAGLGIGNTTKLPIDAPAVAALRINPID